MTDSANWGANFGGAGMQAYEDALVEPMFTPWAEHLLDQVEVAPGEALLDVACGPGTVSRVAAQRLGASGRVTGCDLSPAMLDIATAKPKVNGADITYIECSAEALGVDDASHDVVVCQQGFQFFPDRAAALAEMRRAARDGARVGIAVWCEIAQCPPFAAMATALGEVLGADVASSFINGPWGFSDAEELSSVVEAAGFRDVRIETDTIPLVFESGVSQLLQSLGAAPAGQRVAALGADGQAEFRDAVARAAAPLIEGQVLRSEVRSNTVLALV